MPETRTESVLLFFERCRFLDVAGVFLGLVAGIFGSDPIKGLNHERLFSSCRPFSCHKWFSRNLQNKKRSKQLAPANSYSVTQPKKKPKSFNDLAISFYADGPTFPTNVYKKAAPTGASLESPPR